MALNCQVHNCFYNDKEGKCFAKTIAIGGVNAQTTAGTTCESYVPDENSQNYEFAADFMEANHSPSDVQNIKCAARNCRFNVDTACKAITVEIDNQNARCETFEQ